MIVTCEFCETSFQLDEARIPAQGIRVRCSRCKEAFFLPHPSASNSEAVHEVAGQAAASGAPSPPDSTQDLHPSSEVAGSDEINNEDEADWEFNHEPRPEPDFDPAARADGNTYGSATREEPSGLSLAEDEEALDEGDIDGIDLDLAEGDEGAEVSPDLAQESAFGSVDDFSSLMEEDPGQQVDADLGPEENGSLLQEEGELGSAAGQHAANSSSDELGEPENWDFFSDDSTEGGGAAPSMTPLAKIDLVPASSVNLADVADSWDDEAYAEESGSPAHVMSALRIAGNAIGWVVTIGLVAIGLVSGLRPTAEAVVSTGQRIELGYLRTEPVRGEWLDTARAGRLLVVSGGIDHAAEGSLRLDGGLQLALVAADGRRLEVDPSPLGTALSEADLRELSREELRAARSRARIEFARRGMAPGETVQFQAIFSEVPLEAARFVLERSPEADLEIVADFDVPPPGAEKAGGPPSPADPGPASTEDHGLPSPQDAVAE